jgi:hypothetical protein
VSVGVAVFLLWVVSPVAATIGYLQVAIPAQLFGLSARLCRVGLRGIGLDSSALKWVYTPWHRRLFGEPATFLDRAAESPEQFGVVVVGIRVTGILFVILALSAAVLGAVLLATG